ncbi:MAG: hypothetical protein NZ898_15635 [Myxococcota bacterium]|nr:hypothetical protein [Myxococcota bacterium]MDW8361801.1 hypothetical protein [Myxococcales bacterium]
MFAWLQLGCASHHGPPGSTDAAADAATDAVPGADGAGGLACSGPSECVLLPRTCCGRCGLPTPGDMIALHRSQADAYQREVCDGVACPECAGTPDPYLIATCREGRCVALDLRDEPITSCSRHDECVVATNRCCGCPNEHSNNVLAYNPSRGSLHAFLCDGDVACRPCAGTEMWWGAWCDAGRCVATRRLEE